MLAKNPLPDFYRVQWVSARARSVWEARINSIVQHFEAAERASVGSIRSAALQNVSPDQFPELAHRAVKIGLVANPVGYHGRTNGYAATAVTPKPSEPWQYRVALTMPAKARQFIEAWENNDDETIGILLGYPRCCCDFFLKTWGAGSVDPTWEMADRGDGPIEANILLRWLGVRYIPHLPCGFRCDATIWLGKKFRAEIQKRECGWMDELLSMPMLWSSLNGIGEVITPIVTLNFRSDMGGELLEIRREGSSYAEAGAQAGRFPYRPEFSRRSNQKTMDPDPVEKCRWTDNGFSSFEAMEAGHKMICDTLEAHMKLLPHSVHARNIIDLGAGNGELLRKLGRGIGVESDSRRYSRKVWPGVMVGRIQDVEDISLNRTFAVAIVSIRRFEEMAKREIEVLRTWLERSVDRVLIYQYEQPQFARIIFPRDLLREIPT